MRALMLGAGAVGGYVGGRLVQAGRDVDFLVRPGRADRLRQDGLRIAAGPEVDVIDAPIVTASTIAEPYDLVLLGVKAQALAAAIEDVRPAVGPETVLLPFLNGIAHIDTLAEAFGRRAVLGGTLKIVTQLADDGTVEQLAPGGQIEVGELDGSVEKRTEQIAQLLAAPDFSVSISANIMDAMWAKWVFIATIGAVTSLARGPIGDAAAVEGGTEFAEAVLAEAASVAHASGHPLPAPASESLRTVVTTANAPTTSSLSRDLLADRPTEAENVIGDLVRHAHRHGLPVPRLEAAALTLRAHEARVARNRH